MTKKYESVLSEADKKEIREKYLRGFISQKPCDLIELTEQATLAKLQPQLDAIGAGGVSGQRITKNTEEWVLSLDGRSLYSSDFTHDVMLRVSGDFENDDQRIEYSNSLIAKLNAPISHQVSLGGQPFRKQPVCYVEPACTIEAMGGYRVCKDGDGFPVYRYPHIPEGYNLVPIELTEDMVDASGCEGQFKLSPSDQAQRLWSAMLSAAPTPETKANQETKTQELRIVFSGEAPNLTFVDVENEDGFSVNAGEWRKRFDRYTELRIKATKE